VVDFLDLRRQGLRLEPGLREAFSLVLRGGTFILGEEVRRLEEEFASYLGAGHAVGTASGTDALLLSLKALGIGPGDEVVVPALTAPPTVVAVCLSGARPALVDVDGDTLTIDPAGVEAALGPHTRAVLPVHLYGNPAPLGQLSGLCEERGMVLVEDACQAHGAALEQRPLGTWGRCGCFSFYPTKNLGALGDGGMVVTDDGDLAERLRSLRDYGRRGRDLLEEVGMNSRLDELQAAFLRVKLPLLEEWNRRRRELAERYSAGLQGLPLRMPAMPDGSLSARHLFVVLTPRRDALARHLAEEGIGTAVHYPLPIHLHPAFAFLGHGEGDFPRAEQAASQVLSLPLYPELEEGEVDAVISSLSGFFS
jgi:dTDP-3-amino-3,4,6-trideoxy-alpha-D-glucose transaminase